MKISDLLIGLTVVAFGTSAPELVVNLVAAISGNNEIALTNVLGSNIINVFIILGVSATIYPIVCQKSLRHFEIPLAALAGLVVLLMGMNFFIPSMGDMGISRVDGIILLLIFIIFMYQTIKTGLKDGVSQAEEEVKVKALWLSLLMIAGGLALLIVGGNLIVNSATAIARSWGVSDAIIGVTVVALGTSLPELASAIAAARKGKHEFVLGNIIGSNFFNTLAVVGLAGGISPITEFSPYILTRDIPLMIGASVLVSVFGVNFGNLRKGGRIVRFEGALWTAAFAAYTLLMLYQEVK